MSQQPFVHSLSLVCPPLTELTRRPIVTALPSPYINNLFSVSFKKLNHLLQLVARINGLQAYRVFIRCTSNEICEMSGDSPNAPKAFTIRESSFGNYVHHGFLVLKVQIQGEPSLSTPFSASPRAVQPAGRHVQFAQLVTNHDVQLAVADPNLLPLPAASASATSVVRYAQVVNNADSSQPSNNQELQTPSPVPLQYRWSWELTRTRRRMCRR